MRSKPVSVGTADSRWLSWYPKAGWDSGFWVQVAKRAKERKVKRNDRVGIVKICNEVYALMRRR